MNINNKFILTLHDIKIMIHDQIFIFHLTY